MKKRNLAAILPIIASSLAFTGCNTTTTSYSEGGGEAYALGSQKTPSEEKSVQRLLNAQRKTSLESAVDETQFRSLPYYAYNASNELTYDTSELHRKDRPRFEGDEITVDNDVVTYIDSLSLTYMPKIDYWMDKGNDISSKTRRYTNISKKTSSGWDFDTDFDLFDPKDSKLEMSKKFRNGSKLVIEGTPDDKEYASIKYDVPYEVGMNAVVTSVQAMVAWMK